ncbi:uncharacterized protein LOC135951064 [Calliphora vicina]|uniref:uncharacterized protein LOC135951064 n=1 Tax=Calliphora vicina TaxID=7373 RepID=UPI00325B6755
MYWSGMPREDDIHQYGVGILVNNRFRKAILDYKFVNERIMMMRFKGTGRNLTIVQCYAPTEDATSDAKDAFYDSLTNAIGTIMKNDMKVLMGDFNAKVGAENTDLQHIMGVHGIGTMNNNGERLVELCGVNEFKIGGTLFPHKHCHKVTWRSPDNKTENQIDHICVSAKWSNCLCDVRNRRGADIGSDHHLLVGNLRFIVGRVKRNRNSKCHRVKYNTDKLKSSHQRNIFVQLLETKLMEPSPMNTIEQNWTSIKSAVLEACIEGLGRSRNTKEEFITQRTWKIIDERAKLKNKINATRSISERKLIQREYTLKDKQVKRAIRDDKREHMTNFVREAENAAAAHNMKDLFKITKKIAGSRARRSVPVKNLQGQLLTNIDDQLKRWKQHFMSVLNVQREGIVITNNTETISGVRQGCLLSPLLFLIVIDAVSKRANENKSFETISGVRQGCLLSPLLFLIVIDAVSKRANENKSRGIMWNPTTPIDRLESLDYADDKCELSHRLCDMQDKLNDLAYTSSTVGLRINIAKTKEIRINSRSDDPLILHQKHVQRVEDFQYLGSVVTEDGGTIKDVESRIRKMSSKNP